MEPKRPFDWKKYLFVFCITVIIFLIANSLSGFFTNRKLEELKAIQDRISIDILSSETQFSLLSELSCKDVSASNLSQELSSLAEKIEYSERNLKANAEVVELKKYYTLLQIKDYLLMRRISERCGTKIVGVLYFYTTAENCTDCIKQGYVLTELRQKYPDMRVYSFDYNLDLSALRALLSVYKVEDTKLPALVIDERLYTGFRTVAEVEQLAPELPEGKAAAEKAAAAKKAE